MKNPVFLLLSKTSQRGALWFLFALLLLCLYAFHGLFPFSMERLAAVSGGKGIPDAHLFYSYSQLHEMLQQYGVQGRSMYLKLQAVDTVYPLVYSVFLASLLFAVFQKTRLQNMVYIPLAAALFDYAENILLRMSILSFPHMSKSVVQMAATATFMKWVLLFWAFLMLVLGIVRLLWIKYKHR